MGETTSDEREREREIDREMSIERIKCDSFECEQQTEEKMYFVYMPLPTYVPMPLQSFLLCRTHDRYRTAATTSKNGRPE